MIIFVSQLQEFQIFVLPVLVYTTTFKNTIYRILKPFLNLNFLMTIQNRFLCLQRNCIPAVLNRQFVIISLNFYMKKICYCDITHKTLIHWNVLPVYHTKNWWRRMVLFTRDTVWSVVKSTRWNG